MRQDNDFDILSQPSLPQVEACPYAPQIQQVKVEQARRNLLQAFGFGKAQIKRPTDVSMAYVERYRQNPDMNNSEQQGY